MSDGILFFETGALASNVTVNEADVEFINVDAGIKYKGFALHTELTTRQIRNFDADGDTPYTSLSDKALSIQAMYMVIPRTLNLYAIHSRLFDEFKRNPYEIGGGVNIYPSKSRSWRLNAQAMYIYKSAGGGVFGLYNSGQTGTTITIGTDILL